MELNHTIDPELKAFVNECLKIKGAVDKYPRDDLIEEFTVKLPNNLEVDFKLINGNEDGSTPWLDVVLFDGDGYEMSALPITDNEQIEGEYIFYLDDDSKIIINIS